MSIDTQLSEAIVVANRVLVHHRIMDAFGHVSVRDPNDPRRFYMARRTPPELVTADDVRALGLDGELIEPTGEPLFLERYIHSAIYAARADVRGVVHSHSQAAVTFSVSDQPLRAVCHTCGFIGPHVPVFEMRDCARPSNDLLIRDQSLGVALAARLGAENLVLMRGHGSTVVGGSLEQAVYRAVYTEVNANVQLAAAGLGAVTYLSPSEIAAIRADEDVLLERSWALWRARFGEDAERRAGDGA